MRSDELKPEIDPALVGIAEEMKESGGHWQPCSGCYDTEDGHPTAKYPYSPALQTPVGSGCHECGGLGAVWWHMSEQDIADYEKICEEVDTEVRLTTRVLRLEFALRGLSKAYAACNGEGHPAYEDAQRALADATPAQVQDVAGWQRMDSAPKDGTPILAWCDHEADPYHDEEADRLTDYGCWAEALSRVQNGLAVVQWGGEDTDYDERSGKTLHWPNWWFRVGSDFQEVGNPTHWMPLPAAPAKQEG